MLTLKDYLMGREALQSLTPEMLADAKETVRRANLLLEAFGKAREVASGYRPDVINAKTKGAAKHSNHRICRAIDLEDFDGELDKWCLANQTQLDQIGLWLEHPTSTPGWAHVQIVPPKSGRRVFYP